MSPFQDGSMAEGFVFVYMPSLQETRRVSFLAFKLLCQNLSRDRKPWLSVKRGPHVGAERWEKINAAFAKWQGVMERTEER